MAFTPKCTGTTSDTKGSCPLSRKAGSSQDMLVPWHPALVHKYTETLLIKQQLLINSQLSSSFWVHPVSS